MSTTIGPDDLGLFESPRPQLLREISGIEPEPSGIHVLLDKHAGVRSIQRLALSDVGGGIVVGLWPAELKPQAEYLYANGRGEAIANTAMELGWDVWAVPHLAFYTSSPSQRLYMKPDVDPREYARRWEETDGRRIGQYSSDEVRRELWPWLKERGYATADDDGVLETFLSILGRRPAHLRPALRFHRRWDASGIDRLQGGELATSIRDELNLILRVAGESGLPASASL